MLGTRGHWSSGNDAMDTKDHPVYVVDGNDSTNHLRGIVQVSAGNFHTCALKSNGKVLCWGLGDDGRLGNDATGSTNRHDTPVYVVDGDGSVDHLSGIVQVSAGNTHTCALNLDGGVLCWGVGSSGRLGNDGITNKDHPVKVVDGDSSATYLSGIVEISTGNDHTCAVDSDGDVLCWGYGANGRLGNDGTTNKDHPVNVHGIDTDDPLDGDGDGTLNSRYSLNG